MNFTEIKHYVAHWFYNDIFCVVRVQPPGKPKAVIPWTYTKEHGWKAKYQLDGSRPLYNAAELFLRESCTVLVVEGEKCAEKAKEFFPEYVVITWSGGANYINKTDFSELIPRKVILWPDNDEPGMLAMDKLAAELHDYGTEVSVLDVMKLDKPSKFDVADCRDTQEAHELLEKNLYKFEKVKEIDAFPHTNQRGSPLNTIENLKHLMDFCKIEARFNTMTNHIEIKFPTNQYSCTNSYEAALADLASICALYQMPKGDIQQWLIPIADKQRYSPAMQFIESKPWDGTSRIKSFLQTVEAENQQLADKLIYRWMIGAVAAAFTDIGVGLPGVLTFQGAQSIGKTQWFNNLVPKCHRHLIKESLTLDTNSKDSIISCTNIWLGELGEVDNTFNRSSIASLKSFLTRSKDYYRPAYGRVEKEFTRHTSYFASVNHSNFLIDESGNRRWWTVAVKKIDYAHSTDMQQLWAEFKKLLDDGESYYPTHDEIELINKSNIDFQAIDPIEEMILERFCWEDNKRYWNLKMTATEVLQHLGANMGINSSKSSVNRCSSILTKLVGKKPVPDAGKRKFTLPVLKQSQY